MGLVMLLLTRVVPFPNCSESTKSWQFDRPNMQTKGNYRLTSANRKLIPNAPVEHISFSSPGDFPESARRQLYARTAEPKSKPEKCHRAKMSSKNRQTLATPLASGFDRVQHWAIDMECRRSFPLDSLTQFGYVIAWRKRE